MSWKGRARWDAPENEGDGVPPEKNLLPEFNKSVAVPPEPSPSCGWKGVYSDMGVEL